MNQMMKPKSSPMILRSILRLSHPSLAAGGSVTLAVIALGMVLLAGCGGSDSTNTSDSSVVTPPTPTEIPDNELSTNSEPPGGLEMPTGSIPDVPTEDDAPAEQSVQEKPGGIEMPKQGAPAVDAGSNENSGASDDSNPSGTSVAYGTWEEIQQQVTSSGKITVVDLWSLACEPCLKEFPGLVRLHQAYGSKVQCVAVDIDYDGRKTRPPEYYEERVTAFLQSVGADFTTYICRTPSEEVYAATSLDSIPAVLIYDAQGQIAHVFADAGETVGFTYDKDIIPLVAKLADSTN